MLNDRIIIYGGSFDPPHSGHTALMRIAADSMSPCRIMVVPAYESPLKNGHNASFEDRVAMVRASVADAMTGSGPRCAVHVDDVEGGVFGRMTYTCEIVEHYAEMFPGSEIWFLAGSDVLDNLWRWKNIEDVFRKASLLIGVRIGEAVGVPDDIPGKIRFLPDPVSPVSSSYIRGLLSSQPEPEQLSAGVIKYIADHGLYRRRVYK